MQRLGEAPVPQFTQNRPKTEEDEVGSQKLEISEMIMTEAKKLVEKTMEKIMSRYKKKKKMLLKNKDNRKNKYMSLKKGGNKKCPT